MKINLKSITDPWLRFVVAILIAATIMGCASRQYRYNGSGSPNFNQADAKCTAQTMSAYPNAYGLTGGMLRRNQYDMCMRGEGWE